MRPTSLLTPIAALAFVGLAAGAVVALEAQSDDASATGPTPASAVVSATPGPALFSGEARTAARTHTALATVPHGTVHVEDPSLPLFTSEVRTAGMDGVRRTVVRAIVRDDVTIREQVVSDQVVTRPVDEVVAVGTKLPMAPEPPAGVWDRLAQCESGGNWAINTGNGYYGGLQFLASTWRALGGTGLPHQHSRAEQIRIAEKVRDTQGGYGAWPGCARKLGLPR